MADHAHVASTEAIDAFKAGFIVYLGKSRLLLDDACDEVLRLRTWLQSEKRTYWENQVRRRQKILEEARQVLFSAGMSKLREPSAAERTSVQRAQRALTEAEEKLQKVKLWTREYEHRVEPLLRQLESLRTVLANDMPKATAHLHQIVRTLDAYTGLKAPSLDGLAETVEGAADAPADSTPTAPPAEGGAA